MTDKSHTDALAQGSGSAPVAWFCDGDPDIATAFAWKAGICRACDKERIPVYSEATVQKLKEELAAAHAEVVQTQDELGALLHAAEAKLAAQPPAAPVISQHIGWLKQYVSLMDESNWRDMRLRTERQLEELCVDLGGAPSAPVDSLASAIAHLADTSDRALLYAQSRSAALVETDVDAGAKRLAKWIGYLWEGLNDGRIGDLGYQQWSFNGIGQKQFQGGKDDLRDLAQEIVALCRSSAETSGQEG